MSSFLPYLLPPPPPGLPQLPGMGPALPGVPPLPGLEGGGKGGGASVPPPAPGPGFSSGVSPFGSPMGIIGAMLAARGGFPQAQQPNPQTQPGSVGPFVGGRRGLLY